MFTPMVTRLRADFETFWRNDHCFATVQSFNRLIGFSCFRGDCEYSKWNDCVLKCVLLFYALFYELLAIVAMLFFEPDPVSIDQQFGMMFVMHTGLMCVLIWVSLAVHRHDLDMIVTRLIELQKEGAADGRRAEYIRRNNRYSLALLAQNSVQIVIWIYAVDYSCPLLAFQSRLVDQLNVVLYPVAMTLLSLMLVYTIVLVCTILPAFSVEFYILGLDFGRVFENVGPLIETARKAPENWTKLETNLKNCIRRHQELLNLAALLRRRLKLYFLLNLVVDFFLITFSCFQFGISRRMESPRYMFSAFAAATASFNLLLFGYQCDNAEFHISAIKFHLYSSGWVDQLVYSRTFARRYKNFRKLMLIVMERTERKIGFTCGNFYAMSLTTCWGVLQFCYSVFTLLLSVFE